MKIYKCVKTKQNKTPPFKLEIEECLSQHQIQKEWEEEPESEKGMEPDSLHWRGKVKGKTQSSFLKSLHPAAEYITPPTKETGSA